MTGFFLRACLSALAVLAACSTVHAQAAADPAFEAGVALTRRGEFDRALTQFLAAETAGDRSARLYFNLGVVNYRLGRFAQARAAFGRAAEDPETADLANYNRGLVAMAMDDRSGAAFWFDRVEREAREPSLRRLAQVALERVVGRAAGAPGAYRGNVSVLRGWDSNVIVPVGTISDLPSLRRDEFLEARLVWSDAIGDAIEGLGYRVSAMALEYDEVHEGDVAAAEAAINWSGAFLIEAAIGGLAVDDKGYQRTLDVRLQVPVLEADWVRVDLDGGWSRFDPLDGRAADLEGSRYSYGGSITTGVRRLSVGLGYRRLINDRFASALSPEQDRLQLRLRMEIGRLTWRLWGRYTESDYPATRRDEAGDWGLDLAYRLHRRWDLLLEGSRLRNRSTEPELDYTSGRIFAGIRVAI
jgi:hypothetical protein